MTLEENITVIINKLKNMSGKMLGFEKRLKRLEETETMGVADLQHRISKIEDTPCFETEGAFTPNAKFLKWYGEVFNDPIVEAIEEEETLADRIVEQLEQDEVVEEVSPEVLEKLEEVTKDG